MKNSIELVIMFLIAHYWLLRRDFETIGHFRNFALKFVKMCKNCDSVIFLLYIIIPIEISKRPIQP